ncbi:MAG: class I mannose-6-phosphate isomerase [Phycisphaerales bacterium]|nr:MAG: class I mannose-6-phosphate isomerase [Phycisphaerales bacterium]
MSVGPLLFEPIFKPKIWGGRQLEQRLGRKLPPGEPIGESWEVADLEDDQSVVRAGPAKGKTLGALVKEWGKDLIGHAELFEGRFPLLIKFLDAHETLSVQVHPDENTARKLGGRVRVKNEAWYILHAEGSGCIYRGLKPGVDATRLQTALAEDHVESVLQRINVRKGECYYLPSGTLHALGAGVVVAEVQTPSDITYRIYDWNRIDEQTGKPRDLHIEQAMECIAFDAPLIPQDRPHHVAGMWTTVTRLVLCESFMIERIRMVGGVEREIPHSEFVIWIMLEGQAAISYKGASQPLEILVGDTVLLPAGIQESRVHAIEDATWLEVSIPLSSDLAELEKLTGERASQPPAGGGGFVSLNVPKPHSNNEA